ncbi:MAG: hypothetical protein IKO26_09885 [Paludibacteraceae bacterium]|nr:hypothetical protein [Paludibacteraceae bacterium]
MKKVFLLACLLFSTLLTIAQTKKVAILEVVDREGKLSYSQKVLLRSTMARAITNREGYEAYDRTDVDVIMSEHEFQRTGLVSEAEIRKLGEMTGVSLILVTEGVLTGESQLFVSAKIINIETAKVEMMDNISMGTSNNEMQEKCNLLIKRMIGVSASVMSREKELKKSSNTRAIVASTFIPGMGQMLKGQGGAGAAFLVSEVVLFGSGTVCYFLGQKQAKIMKSTGTTYEQYTNAKNKKNIMDIAMYSCFGVGAAVHIANMIHAWYVADKHLSANISFAPSIIQINEYSQPAYAYGAGVQIQF